MKFKTLLPSVYVFLLLFHVFINSNAQPSISFSGLPGFPGKPSILGQTATHTFCLYPNDSTPQLVIYNQNLEEQSRIPFHSIIPGGPAIAWQAFVLGNKLTLVIQQKTGSGVNIECIKLDENAARVGDKILASDTLLTDFPKTKYYVEVSDNEKYILLYSGIKLSAEKILFQGYLFDNNFNNIKQFAVSIDKHETEDSWFGGMIDIEGNIHTLVFSADNNWRKGTTIRIHTLPMLKDEMQSEQIEVGKRRLVNYIFNEDTVSHTIQLLATTTRQHTDDALAGIALVTFPLHRRGKIGYVSYDFSRDQKKAFAKDITSKNDLLGNSIVTAPLPFMQGSSFFTSMLIQSDYPGIVKILPASDNKGVTKLNELYMPDKATDRGQGNVPYYSAPNQNSDKIQQEEINQLKNANVSEKNNANMSRSVRLVMFKNNIQGTPPSYNDRVLRKGVLPFYDASFSIVKDNHLEMLTYLLDNNKATLYLLSSTEALETKKIETPANTFLLFSDARLVNRNTCVLPYVQTATGKYGIAKVVF